ncbi:MAG: hypothetical protein AB9836_07290 [Aminipila sp.]
MIKYRPICRKQQDIDNIVFRARVMWRKLSLWIYSYLFSKTLNADTELEEVIVNKLISATEDFQNLVRMFFGDKAADDYTKLLSNYIKLFIDLINALAEGNSNTANVIVEQIYQNAGERVEFLASINPYWDKNTLQNYIFNFTDMTVNEINTFTSKRYKESLDIFDRILTYSTSLGDFMAQGIKDYLTYNLQMPTTVIPQSIE